MNISEQMDKNIFINILVALVYTLPWSNFNFVVLAVEVYIGTCIFTKI